ncbi:serine/threonine-protein kinase [Streptomyces sp. NPDC093225]|uniref:serine/threonine-protein kinase n=1 Tax=Streptomyces sp. NPDC093225 TaxID=3366034 RepID=UPI00380BA379
MDQLAFGDPQQIGGHRLLARLGEGGMGRVYLARSPRGRTVAVKLVHQELARRPEFRERFRQEVAAARRVGGRWTAPVLDADTEAPVPWLATGYVAGPSLRTVVDRDHGPLPERSARILAAGLAHALQDIHAAGLIHRDLKPSNVLVTIDGPRVIDFGIARALTGDATADAGLTRTGEIVGSPGFMAPEQVRGEPVTPACDVFCLGSVLAYAVSGALPFGEATGGPGGLAALLLRIAEREPDLGGVPESLRGLVRDCLHKDPAARPSPADVLARVGAGDTVADGRALEPWLPGALVAQLGRHAVRLLEREDAGPVREDTMPVREDTMPVAEAPAPYPPAPHRPAPPYGPTAAAGSAGWGVGVGGAGAVAGSASGAVSGTVPGGFGPPAAGQGDYGGYGAYRGFGTLPAGPPAAGPAPRRTGSTVFLVGVALVVAVLAGGTVYGFVSGGWHGHGDSAAPGPLGRTGSPSGTTPTVDPSSPEGAAGAAGAASGTGGTAAGSAAGAAPDSGIPASYLGSWRSSAGTWRLTLRAGGVGAPVMTLAKTDPAYTCTWTAPLRSAGPPVELDPSTVTAGDPVTCGPGPWSRLTLRADGSLERELVGSGKAPLVYTKEP